MDTDDLPELRERDILFTSWLSAYVRHEMFIHVYFALKP